MGVPKFYRWISERYPCLSEIVNEYQVPEFDNLYLDMNGIIHSCSHPNDDDPTFRITEEKIFKDIFHYIEVLFRIVRPKKVFLMAVDGVAPRAKMNQQRSRRFRSAKDAEIQQKKAIESGMELPSEDRFDSNCITPGTSFMARLNEQLKYFVNMKITTDELWRNRRIILSGHETPGEGEHKIMDFIRFERSQKGYDPNTRHCLYGLDADLVMLGLLTHEPHFSLLREEVKFVKRQEHKTVDQTTFHLLHLSLLREYLELEFQELKKVELSFEYSLEHVIDDWVLMGFLIGNDFIPNLPHLHINQDAFPLLYKTYIKILPQLGGYINEGGFLNLKRFEYFLRRLAQFDYEKFCEEYDDLVWLQTKSSSSKEGGDVGGAGMRELESFDDFDEDIDMDEDSSLEGLPKELRDKIARDKAALDQLEEASASAKAEKAKVVAPWKPEERPEGWSDLMEDLFAQHKSAYYREKLKVAHVDEEFLYNQAIQYVEALQWILHYYYNGICSWGWFYPQHYAPYMSDVKNFSDYAFTFKLGKPFLPFQQLLAVLPTASNKHLPAAYHHLMTDPTSPLYHYYPVDFETDLNGKQQEWEAVVLIPFIDEKLLLSEMAKCEHALTEDERKRYVHSEHLCYTTLDSPNGLYKSPLHGVFADIEHNLATCSKWPVDYARLEPGQLRKGLLENAVVDTYYPGFPTLRHLPFSAKLEHCQVKVFQQNSQRESMILTLQVRPESQAALKDVAERMVGRRVHCQWPHLKIGLVESVCDDEMIYYTDKEDKISRRKLEQAESRQSARDGAIVATKYAQTRAVKIGEVEVLVKVRLLEGRRFVHKSKGGIECEKVWAQKSLAFPLQVVIENVTEFDETTDHKYTDLSVLYPPGCTVFVLSKSGRLYGCEAEIGRDQPGLPSSAGDKAEPKLSVRVKGVEEPDFDYILDNEERLSLWYWPGRQMAQKLGISTHFLSRITGTVYMMEKQGMEMNFSNKQHIGLNIKFGRKNEEVPDYAKKVDNDWHYSKKVFDILTEYAAKYGEVFHYMHDLSAGDDVLYASKVFVREENPTKKMQELVTWIKGLPCSRVQRQAVGTETVDDRMITAISEQIGHTSAHPVDYVTMSLPLSDVYRPSLNMGISMPDPDTQFALYDRVVNVREGFVVPLGLRGTVVGLHPGGDGATDRDFQVDVIFDEAFLGGQKLRTDVCNGYRLPAFALINLTYGRSGKAGKGAPKTEEGVKSQRNAHSKHESPRRVNPSAISIAKRDRSDRKEMIVENVDHASDRPKLNSLFATKRDKPPWALEFKEIPTPPSHLQHHLASNSWLNSAAIGGPSAFTSYFPTPAIRNHYPLPMGSIPPRVGLDPFLDGARHPLRPMVAPVGVRPRPKFMSADAAEYGCFDYDYDYDPTSPDESNGLAPPTYGFFDPTSFGVNRTRPPQGSLSGSGGLKGGKKSYVPGQGVTIGNPVGSMNGHYDPRNGPLKENANSRMPKPGSKSRDDFWEKLTVTADPGQKGVTKPSETQYKQYPHSGGYRTPASNTVTGPPRNEFDQLLQTLQKGRPQLQHQPAPPGGLNPKLSPGAHPINSVGNGEGMRKGVVYHHGNPTMNPQGQMMGGGIGWNGGGGMPHLYNQQNRKRDVGGDSMARTKGKNIMNELFPGSSMAAHNSAVPPPNATSAVPTYGKFSYPPPVNGTTGRGSQDHSPPLASVGLLSVGVPPPSASTGASNAVLANLVNSPPSCGFSQPPPSFLQQTVVSLQQQQLPMPPGAGSNMQISPPVVGSEPFMPPAATAVPNNGSSPPNSSQFSQDHMNKLFPHHQRQHDPSNGRGMVDGTEENQQLSPGGSYPAPPVHLPHPPPILQEVARSWLSEPPPPIHTLAKRNTEQALKTMLKLGPGLDGGYSAPNRVEDLKQLCRATGRVSPKFSTKEELDGSFVSIVAIDTIRFKGEPDATPEVAVQNVAALALINMARGPMSIDLPSPPGLLRPVERMGQPDPGRTPSKDPTCQNNYFVPLQVTKNVTKSFAADLGGGGDAPYVQPLAEAGRLDDLGLNFRQLEIGGQNGIEQMGSLGFSSNAGFNQHPDSAARIQHGHSSIDNFSQSLSFAPSQPPISNQSGGFGGVALEPPMIGSKSAIITSDMQQMNQESSSFANGNLYDPWSAGGDIIGGGASRGLDQMIYFGQSLGGSGDERVSHAVSAGGDEAGAVGSGNTEGRAEGADSDGKSALSGIVANEGRTSVTPKSRLACKW